MRSHTLPADLARFARAQLAVALHTQRVVPPIVFPEDLGPGFGLLSWFSGRSLSPVELTCVVALLFDRVLARLT